LNGRLIEESQDRRRKAAFVSVNDIPARLHSSTPFSYHQYEYGKVVAPSSTQSLHTVKSILKGKGRASRYDDGNQHGTTSSLLGPSSSSRSNHVGAAASTAVPSDTHNANLGARCENSDDDDDDDDDPFKRYKSTQKQNKKRKRQEERMVSFSEVGFDLDAYDDNDGASD
jgi:hypothetical protein